LTLFLSAAPSPLSFVVAIAILDGIAIAAMLAARKWSARRALVYGAPIVNAWSTVTGALCALLFAFTIATLWSVNRSTIVSLNAESTAIRLAARDIPAAQLSLLREYVNATVADWPSLCGGASSERSNRSLIALERNVKPATRALADDYTRQLEALEQARSARLQAATSSIPREVRIALVVLSIGVIVVLALANPENSALHLALMLAVGTSLGTMFWVMTLLDYPFCGATAISPKAMIYAMHAAGM
jgi:uncharacterized membrane protein